MLKMIFEFSFKNFYFMTLEIANQIFAGYNELEHL